MNTNVEKKYIFIKLLSILIEIRRSKQELPHVDMKGVDNVDEEPTGPTTTLDAHQTNTQQWVEVETWPVKRQHAVG